METLFIYIAKSSGLLILFYCTYYFLLRQETFFNSSRWFLLAGLITSVALPFLVYTKIIWVDPQISNINYSQVYIPQNIEKETFEIDWNLVSLIIYAIGFLAFMIKFTFDFYSLNSILKNKKIQQQADFKFIDIKENIAPFSYFDYIVYNSSLYTSTELESIIEHEKVHSDQNHTIDVLISRIFCVLFWFNPIIWLYKKAILQNLEFIADSEAAKKISDKKAYQYTLLKITTHESCVAITNHFYQSLIKKRIVMLNKNQSKKRNYWKYYAVIPALVAFVFVFQIKTIAQEKKEAKEVSEKISSVDVYKIKKTTTDQELKVMSEKLKQNHDVDVTISDVKRNSKNELTSIKVDLQKGTEEVQTIQIEGNEAIKSCGIIITTDDNGSKKINLVTDGGIDKPMVIKNHVVEARETKNQDVSPTYPVSPAPPAPPTMPVFPEGPMPAAPAVDMSKMPKPPVAPTNPQDKAAMKKFEKEMAEFEKKMEAYEPDMSAYEKEVDEIMEKRSAIFDKEMEKYDLAMEKFNADMEKYNEDIEQKYGENSKQYKQNMEQHKKDMKQHAKDMKEHEKNMKRMEQESK
ncbi:M56 family metallopeptidase [Flavobacterium sp. CF136]|uniref:M56 family metallopeptidase n=1 Tax=Flavobacterium sp. (strain CF136) TaxID=1144313 RepID=UPI000271C99E|nr:M56 family metallopeptidase [Flavobacterium sp. CF136]EJL65195.1 antirepressor regulating drug resistance protein [Flavobacterium sp. CF136]